jgi:ribosomal protein S18 acetylase RimI-like enzyme
MEINENDWIKISESIFLRSINLADHAALYDFMKTIYLQAYRHLWVDGGRWYLDRIYGWGNFRQELAEPDSFYYFIEFDGDKAGILRLQNDTGLVDFPDKKAAKLQRIYLDAAVQGNGIGRELLDWTVQRAKQAGYALLWLEVMDTQEQAIGFYKKSGFVISGAFRLAYERVHPQLRGMYRMLKTL